MVDHLFLGYPFSRAVLNWVFYSFGLSWVMLDSLLGVLRQWSSPFSLKAASFLWVLSFYHYIWQIWKERNNIIFKDKKKDVLSTCISMKSSVAENWKLIDFSDSHIPDLERHLLSCWNLSPPKILLRDKSNRESCRWIRPPEGWVKCNFDGATKGNLGLAGAGGLCRNAEGTLLGTFAKPLGS
eukprot:Gb_11812 [translate_table: standard]